MSGVHGHGATASGLAGGHAFAGMPNVVLTPHTAGTWEETMGNVLPGIGGHVGWAIQQDRQGSPREPKGTTGAPGSPAV